MKVAVFSTKPWTEQAFIKANKRFEFDITFHESRLNRRTASLAEGFDGVCVFVNDVIDAETLKILHKGGVRIVALRCAGFNNVDIRKAHELSICVTRVPAYSPYAVAEHTVTLMLALNRRIHRAYNCVRDGNFALDGLMGFDMHGRTAGVIGTGKIGGIVCELLLGFGMRVLAYDMYPRDDLREKGVEYVELDPLYDASDIITLHCPLTHETYHMINSHALEHMKEGVMLVNTSRGALIDTTAVIEGIKSERIGHLALDVYEEEADLFFEDLSDKVIRDDTFMRLQTFPNVLITGHQAFFTRDAVDNITETTFNNLKDFAENRACNNIVLAEKVLAK